MNRLCWAVLGVMAVLFAWHIDTWFTPNPSSRAMLVASIAEHHSYHVDSYSAWSEDKAFVRGHYYSDKAPLASWITVPLYSLVSRLTSTNGKTALHPATLICGSIMSGIVPVLIFVGLLLSGLRNSSASPALSVLYVTAAVPCSLIGLYAGTFFGHILAGLLLCLAWRDSFHRGQPLTAGLFVGLAGLAEFPLLLFVPFLFFGLLMRGALSRRRSILEFALGLLPGVLFLLAHNLLTTGQPFEFAYKYVDSPSFQHMKLFYGFRLPSLHALWGLTFSASHGVLLHAPILIALGFYLMREGAKPLRRIGMHPGTWSIAAYLLLVSSYQMWEGGWAFGPRHLIPLVMVLMLEGVSLVPGVATRAWTLGLIAAATLGGTLVFLAKSTTVYMVPTWLTFPITDLFAPKIMKGEWNPNVVPSWLFSVSPKFSHILWAHLLVLFTAWLWGMAFSLEPRKSNNR